MVQLSIELVLRICKVVTFWWYSFSKQAEIWEKSSVQSVVDFMGHFVLHSIDHVSTLIFFIFWSISFVLEKYSFFRILIGNEQDYLGEELLGLDIGLRLW